MVVNRLSLPKEPVGMGSFKGHARLGKRTKSLVKRLKNGDIPIINHRDLDRVTAEMLLEKKVRVVVNAESFSTGRYPNLGPLYLVRQGVVLIEAEPAVFEKIREGEEIEIANGDILREGKVVVKGHRLSGKEVEERLKKARRMVGAELKKFAQNTLSYLAQETDLFFGEIQYPSLKTSFVGKHALVVVRGYDYKEDLRFLRSYIRDVKPVLVAVDGGADALLEQGLKPHVIVGDMDSVSDRALLSGAELVVHAYPDGSAPGLERLKKLGVEAHVLKAPGTSEDLGLLLSHDLGADLIVAVGTHANLVEFLDKGREGMASTFLVRLKVGEKLVDAKGVNQLYRSKVKLTYFVAIFLAILSAFTVVILASPLARNFVRLLVTKVRLVLGV
jgi:uncharacterized membrane-anchored protein